MKIYFRRGEGANLDCPVFGFRDYGRPTSNRWQELTIFPTILNISVHVGIVVIMTSWKRLSDTAAKDLCAGSTMEDGFT
jgi:hypothetical protein